MTPAVSLAENPAVTNPMLTLSKGQRDALLSIHFYRHQRRGGGFWMFGDKRFAVTTITVLERHGLVSTKTRLGPIVITTAGQLVIDKIKAMGK